MKNNDFILLGNKKVGLNHPPFIIAEMSGNHNQSLDRALKIVDAAADSGAHALKIQTYTPDTMTLDLDEREFHIGDPDNLWTGRSLYDLYGEAYTPWEWHKPIFDRAKEHGMLAISTPFDDTSVDFLETLEVPFYKIASFENTDLPLIKKVASTGKPIIISTGMMSISEMDDAVKAAKKGGCNDLILLKCTSTYPSSPEGTNLKTIPVIRKMFDCEVGLSDHTMGIGSAVASVCFGSTVIEKHFTLNRSDGGVDSTFSLEPHEMDLLVIESERAWSSLGNISFGPSEKEENSKIFRRSLYIVEDMKAGEIITKKNMRAIRPGHGLSPKYFEKILGMKVNKDINRGTAIDWSFIGQ
jgi:N-acetylneuraminate synthase